jgi:hypothetical protein
MANSLSAAPPDKYFKPYLSANRFATVLFPHPVNPATQITIVLFGPCLFMAFSL